MHADTQTDRQTDHNTLLPYRARVKWQLQMLTGANSSQAEGDLTGRLLAAGTTTTKYK